MKFSLFAVSALLGVTAAYSGEEAIRKAQRPRPVIEKSSPAGFQDARLQKRAEPYLNDKTKKFSVNGTGLPDVPFDIGESYAGLLPISSKANETRELFFWFFPSTNPAAAKEVAIWFNGGPGCSSLSGLLTENGPFTWQSGTLDPVLNPYSWVNLTNTMWVEQPVGVGYTQGVPDISNEEELAQEFLGFYKQWVDTFDAHGWKVYLTGESYGGYYVPYIANAFVKANDKDYYNLKGININDPIIGDGTNQQQTVIPNYVRYWNNLLYLNDTFLEAFYARSDSCGYTDYMDKYFKFPPPGPLPLLTDPYSTPNNTCDVFDDAFSAILEINPCFNIYHISEMCPHPFNPLGGVNTGDYVPADEVVYFNRTDVQQALHAVVGTDWQQCTKKNVFGKGTRRGHDESDPPATNGVLQNVIEATNNVLIGSGDLDMLLSTNGTLLAIQNMTWNGCQGLDHYPDIPFYTPYHPEYNGGALAGAGYLGSWGYSRGLTFYRVQLAGHELPGYAPGASYRSLEVLLGRVANLSVVGDFTTQTGNYTGSTPVLF
ncbi:serine carboxypeptidase [Myriangium duriaei CBS 260.36]|uniref:Carboxypeptidase n=1 Tax=Myriangium duriaei CBS 260.36 TaxID=1168546 RepID=A0A9P4J9Y6_9PEZI|nr:serine carboxypeptidase [Myriangium duriaei CBS 260.36]